MYLLSQLSTEEYLKRIVRHDPAVIKAWVEGKTIQYNSGSGWRDHATPDWSASKLSYRLKPEPEYEWLVSYTIPKPAASTKSTTCIHTFDNEAAATREYEAATRHSRTYTNISIKKREVAPEVRS